MCVCLGVLPAVVVWIRLQEVQGSVVLLDLRRKDVYILFTRVMAWSLRRPTEMRPRPSLHLLPSMLAEGTVGQGGQRLNYHSLPSAS